MLQLALCFVTFLPHTQGLVSFFRVQMFCSWNPYDQLRVKCISALWLPEHQDDCFCFEFAVLERGEMMVQDSRIRAKGDVMRTLRRHDFHCCIGKVGNTSHDNIFGSVRCRCSENRVCNQFFGIILFGFGAQYQNFVTDGEIVTARVRRADCDDASFVFERICLLYRYPIPKL